jgi:hypothetical protein
VVHDFVRKLQRNPAQLEILGDGTQRRSFVLVDDCVEAMLLSLAKAEPNDLPFARETGLIGPRFRLADPNHDVPHLAIVSNKGESPLSDHSFETVRGHRPMLALKRFCRLLLTPV